MAKFEERDERWIVEHRDDGANVNNWHWTERDYSKWAHDVLKEIFKDEVIYQDEDITIKYDGVKKSDGEVTVSTRKGKVFCFYELELNVNWLGYHDIQGTVTEAKGTLFGQPEHCQDEDPGDFEIQCKVETDKSPGKIISKYIREKGPSCMKNKFRAFVQRLYDEKMKTALLPSGGGSNPSINGNKTSIPPKDAVKSFSKNVVEDKVVKNDSVQTINYTEKFRCPSGQIYSFFTESNLVSGLTQSGCTINLVEGGHFTLFSGNVQGTIISFEKNSFLKQHWRFSDWSDGIISYVELTFKEEEPNTCTVVLKHSNIPKHDYERALNGWKSYFFTRISSMFGYK